MELPFMKLEGLGNCYIFVEAGRAAKTNLRKLAKAISDVSTGVGSDGLIVVNSSSQPYAVRFFNKDGSEAELCGNGLRQAALFLRKLHKTVRKKYLLSASPGVYMAELLSFRENKALVRTGLGSPDFSASFVGGKDGLAFDTELTIGDGRKIKADCVSMGNPHAVIWVDNFAFDWENLGLELSGHPNFQRGANVHFCRIVNSGRFQMRIYERGSGVTMACGSGAAACLAAGVMKNKLHKKSIAEMPGGALKLIYDIGKGMIMQEGPASIVCSGVFYY